MYSGIKKILVIVVAFLILMTGAFAAEDSNFKDVNFAPYMSNLQKSIKANWKPPRNSQKSNSVILMFKVSKNGKLLSHSIYKSSGNTLYDKAATDALLTTPLKPLPSEFKGESVDVQFTFDYNVYGDSYKPLRKQNSDYNFEVLSENLYATNKKQILKQSGYKYLKIVKVNAFMPIASIWGCKIDCKNAQIGIKKKYKGDSNVVLKNIDDILSRNLMIYDNLKMQSVSKRSDFYRIYNYVCQP